jgi:hypothetical protein
MRWETESLASALPAVVQFNCHALAQLPIRLNGYRVEPLFFAIGKRHEKKTLKDEERIE